ncbi:HPF/RaiA family ribosome-associated protein [Pararhodonellum marinum]|uniref:HPF/RaiA family ribosome-associated protein n=1 Tax=Pararhodonellum marinum TaxID=2755358 RepID=UPI0018900EAC|nr:HPF/RaiA family ribosome-associated protein [Pararhodonellum marinum]
MNYTENYQGIKIDVQSVEDELSTHVQSEIRSCIDKLSRFTREINAVDVYFKNEGQGNAAMHIVGMRVAIPGPGVFAEDKGDNWISLLKSVTDKNIRQLQKVK